MTHPDESARGLAQSKTWRAAGARDSSRLTSILRHAPLLFALCLLSSVLSLPASAQFSLDWWTVDGGGGTSTGGVYSVSGTIGQPDAGPPAHAGGYTLHGGFWSLIAAVQTEGAPWLTIFRTTTNTVTVSWPSPSTGWNLQQNTNSVASVNWSNVTDMIRDDGATKTLIVNPPTGSRFYRLHYQP